MACVCRNFDLCDGEGADIKEGYRNRRQGVSKWRVKILSHSDLINSSGFGFFIFGTRIKFNTWYQNIFV